MTVKTRETLMQRAMTGKPIMGQELRDLIDTMFWLKASPEQRIAQVQQVAGRSTPQEPAAFPDVPGTGFVKIGADRKWFTDPTVYLTQPQGDRLYFRNSLFPMDPATYLAGDRTFKNFVDSARAAFTGGDGIDIVAGDIRVDNTVSRVGHQHALTLSGDVSGSGIVAGTIATTVNAIRGGVVPPPGSAGYFYWTGSSYSWVATPPPTTIALDDLADVALASVTAGQVLWYDGSVGQWINKMLGANDIPAHASRHHSGGSDPLAGQSIAGLLTSSSPTFAGLNVRTASAGTLADISFRATTDFRRMVIRWNNPNDRIELFSNNDDGSSRAARIFIPRSSSIPVSILLGLTVTGTTTLDTSLSGMVKATAGVVGVAGAADLPLHASRHQWDGADPIQGQQLSGLRAHETPTFGGIRGGSVIGYLPFLENNGTEIMRLSSTGMLVHQNISLDGDLRIANFSGLLAATNGTVRLATALDLPAHTHYTSEVTEDTNLWFTYQRARDAITGRHPISVVNGVVSHVNTDGYKHVPANGTTNSGKFLVSGGGAGSYTWETISVGALPIHAFNHQWNGSDPLDGQSIEGLRTTSSPVFAGLTVGSLTGMVKATAGVLSAASASDLPSHASRHHYGGADPLTGSSIAGLRISDAPRWASLGLVAPGSAADLDFRSSDALRKMTIRWTSDQLEFFSSNDDGSSRTNRLLLPRSSSLAVQIFRGLTITGTTTLDTSLSGMVKATAGVLSAASASDLPAHASRHHSGGADPLVGQSIAGLLTTDSPEFNRLNLGSELRLKYLGVQEWGIVAGNSGFELASRNSDWSAIDWPVTIGHAAGGVIRLGGTTSRPVNLTYTLQMGGTTTINSSREGILTRLSVIKSLGATIETASRVDLINDTGTWGASSWTDSGGNLRLAFLQGDAVWTDRFKFLRTGAFQIGGADAITASRGGRLTDLIVTGQTTLSTSLTGLLKGAAGVIGVASASDLPSHTHSASQISDSTATGRSILVAADQATARTALGLTSWAIKAFTNGSTTDVAEGTNLYYTDARARASITATTPIIATAGVISHSAADGNLHVPATGTTSNGKWLRAGSTAGSVSWQTLSSSDLPSHASLHHWNGADPLAGQSIAGLLVTSTPKFAGITLGSLSSDSAYLRFHDSSGVLKHQICRYTNANGGGLAIMDAGSILRLTIPSLASIPMEIEKGLSILTGDLTLNTSFNGLLKAANGVVSVASLSDIAIPFGRIPFGGSSGGMTYSDKLRFNDPYTDMLCVDSSATFNGTVYANDIQLPMDGSIVSFSAVVIQFGDGVSTPRVLFPNIATNKAFQVDGLATFAHISAYLLEGDVQADRDEIGSSETRTLPAATTIGQEVRFCAGVGPSTYTVQVATPASEVIRYRSRTTGLPRTATSLDVADSATTFVCHAVGRWTAIGY